MASLILVVCFDFASASESTKLLISFFLSIEQNLRIVELLFFFEMNETLKNTLGAYTPDCSKKGMYFVL
jgi:hypothetical protein